MANFQSVPSRSQSWKQLASYNAQRAASTRTLRALHASLARSSSNSSEQRVYTTLQAVLIAVAILILTPAILVVLS